MVFITGTRQLVQLEQQVRVMTGIHQIIRDILVMWSKLEVSKGM